MHNYHREFLRVLLDQLQDAITTYMALRLPASNTAAVSVEGKMVPGYLRCSSVPLFIARSVEMATFVIYDNNGQAS